MPPEIKHRWLFSVRFKLFGIYLLIILIIFGCILGIFPKIFQAYMLERSQEDLLTTKQIIQETLEQTSFQTTLYMREKLDAVARAKGIEIWICKQPITQTDSSIVVPTIRLGSDTDTQDLQLSSESAVFIEAVRTGQMQDRLYEDQFPEYYSQKTMTLAYSTLYYENVLAREMNVESTAVILLNIGLRDISNSVHNMLLVVLIVFGHVVLAELAYDTH